MKNIYTFFCFCIVATISHISHAQICDYERSSLLFTLDECQSVSGFPSQTEYDEFTAIPDTADGGTILSVVGDHLYRINGEENMHSCTEGLNESLAMCVGSLNSCDFVANSEKAVRFDIKVELDDEGIGRLSGLSFYEASPATFSWEGGASGINNPPSLYGIRVLVDGAVVYQEMDIETSPEFSLEEFDFSDLPEFRVTEETVFNFELLPYCIIDNGGFVDAWDLEDILIYANTLDNVDGGDLLYSDGEDMASICVGNGEVDPINVMLSNNIGTSNAYVITDVDSVIIAYDVTFPFDFESAGGGTCLIWNISYYDALTGAVPGAKLNDIQGCYDLSNEITLDRQEVNGGTLTGGPFEFCVGDANADNIPDGAITLSGNVGNNSQWIITDEQGVILGLPSNYEDVNFDNSSAGNCLVWHLSFQDGLIGAVEGANTSDLSGCFDLSNPITVIRNERPTVSINPTATLCNEDNGSATATGAGGDTPYNYTWSNGASTATILNLAPGAYTVTVTDANGCTNTAATIINDSTAPQTSTNVTHTTCGDNNGSASASSTMGTAPYSYNWSNGASGDNIDGLAPGTYTVTVTDANGCTDTATATIDSSTSPDVDITSMDTSCGEDNGSASASTVDGVAPYTYIWSNGSTSSTIQGLASGNYRVTVTDASGCTDWAAIDIDDSTAPSVSIMGDDTTCGEDNGSASASTVDGVAPYTYIWSNGSTSSTIQGLASGNYRVTVTDAVGCTDWAAIDIDDSNSPLISASATGTTCGLENGSISATVSEGVPPYAYLWSTGSTESSIDNLAAGDYQLTVTDAEGCTAVATSMIQESNTISLMTSMTDTSCDEDNGEASVSATDGSTPYTYAWSTGATTASISDLAPGTYQVTVTDDLGCTAEASVSIAESDRPEVTISTTATSCGTNNGSATAMADGGLVPYSYEWSTGDDTATISDLAPGVYSVTITDANGCTTQASTNISDSSSPNIDFDVVDTSCGQSNGSISTTVSQGTAPYSYIWSTGSIDSSIDNLSAGDYSLTVTDANGCSASGTATVAPSTNPSVLVVPTSTSCGEDNGTASASVFGGVSPYTYLWSTGSTANMITGLAEGEYSVTVTDDMGCTMSATGTVEGSTSPQIEFNTAQPSCGEDNGSVTALVSEGQAPFTYQWSNGSTESTITNLAPGGYTLTVTDDAGCTSSASITMADSEGPTASATGMDTSCGLNNGSAEASATGGEGPYTFLWSSADADAMIMGLEPAVYDVTVTDANGCTDVATVTIAESSGPMAMTSGMATICGQDNGSVIVAVNAGTAPYSYEWSNGSMAVSQSDLPAGTYTVTVTDAAGCTDTSAFTVEDSASPSVTVDDGMTTCGEDNGTLVAMATSGTPPYTYLWSNGDTDAEQSGLLSGIYTVTVTDAEGCTASTSASVEPSSSINADASATETTCGENNGMATVDAVGGMEPYTYLWSSGATTQMIMGLEPGDYEVTVTDAQGCSDVAAALVEASSSPTILIGSAPEDCGMMDGAATVSIANAGTPPYTVLWSNGETTEVITNLSAGLYSATVTDANGCSTTGEIEVEGSPAPEGGMIEAQGGTSFEFCQEGTADMLNGLTVTGASGTNRVWVVTDVDGNILSILDDATEIEEINFDIQPTGTCFIYHLSYEDIVGLAEGESVDDISGCWDISNEITVVRTEYNVSMGSSSILFAMESCAASTGAMQQIDYSEFVGETFNNGNCADIEVVGGHLYRENPTENTHSCTEGVNGGLGLCVSSMPGCIYNPDSDKKLIVDLEIDPGSGTSTVTELSFFERAPEMYDWISGSDGINNYPTLFAVRILKDGVVVYQQEDLETLDEWNQRNFTLTGDAFTVSETSVFTIELLGYCIVGNGSEVTAWDIDELTLITECDNTLDAGDLSGGPYDICLDGIPDFITDLTLDGQNGPLTKLILVNESDVILEVFDDMATFSSYNIDDGDEGVCQLYSIAAEADLQGCEAGDIFTADFVGCYAISDPITINKILCGTVVGSYPNPTLAKVTLTNLHKLNGDKTVYLYDNMGALVKTITVDKDRIIAEIDLSELRSGIYHVRVQAQLGISRSLQVLKVE